MKKLTQNLHTGFMGTQVPVLYEYFIHVTTEWE
jgi:hypothetical protein